MKELKHYFSGHLFYKKKHSRNHHRGIEGNIRRELSAGVTKHTFTNGRSHDCIRNEVTLLAVINNKVTFLSIMFLLILLERNNTLIMA